MGDYFNGGLCNNFARFLDAIASQGIHNIQVTPCVRPTQSVRGKAPVRIQGDSKPAANPVNIPTP